MRWFKQQFGPAIAPTIANSPIGENLLTAIAVQETYEVWGSIYKTHAPAEVLNLCVGDTIDAPRRRAFPKDKAALLAVPDGERMFGIARQALEDMGRVIPAYGKIAVAHPDKFCHAFGIFQCDLQAFKRDPDYFLERQWGDFAQCLLRCLKELNGSAASLYPQVARLDHRQSVFCAIAYNTGKADISGDFKQGYKDADGVYYGEYIDRYLTLAESIAD